MSTCFLVLGTPRSGTSCVAGVLHKLGVVMGQPLESEDGKPRFDWPDANEWNPVGFYQDAPLENLEHSIFGDSYQQWPIDTLSGEHESRLSEIITSRESHGVNWGSKTSRAGYLLPHIIRLCKSDVKLIVTQRRESESKSSWSAMTGHDEPLSRDVINCASDAREFAMSLGLPMLTVSFDELMSSSSIIEQIAAFVGVSATKTARDHVNSGLRRFDHSNVKAG